MALQFDMVLRPLGPEDNYMLAELANNKHIWDNVRDLMPFPYMLQHADEFIARAHQHNPPHIMGVIFQGKLCGVAGLHCQPDVYRRSAELGYWIGEPYWNMGIASCAVGMMTRYGFKALGYHRIYANVFAYNVASMRVLEKNGYRSEGINREAVWKNGRFWNEHRYAILATDEKSFEI